MTPETPCTAFEGSCRIASGKLGAVALAAMGVLERDTSACVLIFDDSTGATIEVDFRGTPDDVLKRLAPTPAELPAPATARGPGRPKLGVVAREITLLPRHWEWLNSQPGGASVALRKLVDAARWTHKDRDRVRQSQEAAYRFMLSVAGNEPGFEEAIRALFAGDQARFDAMIDRWPVDVRDHARKLAAGALQPDAAAAMSDRS
jgi:hypothetical protein